MQIAYTYLLWAQCQRCLTTQCNHPVSLATCFRQPHKYPCCPFGNTEITQGRALKCNATFDHYMVHELPVSASSNNIQLRNKSKFIFCRCADTLTRILQDKRCCLSSKLCMHQSVTRCKPHL